MQAMPYRISPTRFRHAVIDGEKLIGTVPSLGSNTVTKVLGQSCFQSSFGSILPDEKHAPNAILPFIPQLINVKDGPRPLVARAPHNNQAIPPKAKNQPKMKFKQHSLSQEC